MSSIPIFIVVVIIITFLPHLNKLDSPDPVAMPET